MYAGVFLHQQHWFAADYNWGIYCVRDVYDRPTVHTCRKLLGNCRLLNKYTLVGALFFFYDHTGRVFVDTLSGKHCNGTFWRWLVRYW